MNNSTDVLDAIDWHILRQLQSNADLSNQELAAAVHTSAPTCLRRVKRLKALGWIESQVAIVGTDRLKAAGVGGLTAILEVSLTDQTQETLAAFEAAAVAQGAVQQCYRVSPGPDFVLIIQARDMDAYLALTQRLLTQDARVRNVKTFFSVKRAKCSAALDWL